MGSDVQLVDDNVRPHRAQLADAFLETEDIARMDLPARSPDLNVTDRCIGIYQSLYRIYNSSAENIGVNTSTSG